MKNLHSIQFLRFVAAFAVVVFHAEYIGNASLWPNIDKGTVAYLYELGASGVHMFFVISGFVMVYATFGGGKPITATDFLFRRFVRIFPIYWACALLYLAYHYALIGESIGTGSLLASLLLIPGYSSLIISPCWTLSYELYFYCCFAAIIGLGIERGLVVLSIFFLSSISVREMLPYSNPFIDMATNSLLIEFLIGAWTAYFVISGSKISNRLADGVGVFGLLGFVCGSIAGYSNFPPVVAWGIPSAAIVIGLVFRENNDALPRIIRDYAFLGDSSYSLYLLHVLLLKILMSAFVFMPAPHIIGRSALYVFVSVVCCVVAMAAYDRVEKRLVESLRRRARPVATYIPS